MKSRTTHHRNRPRWHRSKYLLLLMVLIGVLAACVAPPSYDSSATLPPEAASPSVAPDSAATPSTTPQPSPSTEASSTQFNFPLATCGDRSSEPSETWYSVFVDGGNVDEIRSRYCGDAISATRPKSGTSTVQVASFTSYARALSLAKTIGGVVEQTAQAAPAANGAVANGGYQSADRPTEPQPTPTPQPSALPAQVGQVAFLNASEAGVPINIRENASTAAQVQSTGTAGDRVQISNQTKGDDGYTWYQVRLDSGAAGWVRGDLISAQAPTVSQAPASQPSAADPQPTYPQSPDYTPSPGYSQPPYAQPPAYTQPPYAQPPAYPQTPEYAQSPGYGQSPYTQPPYTQSPAYGQPPAQPNAPYGTPYGAARNSMLTAREPGAVINIREYASPNSRVRYRANPGDPIQVSGSAQGEDGQIWYQIRFPSGALGWVRSDLVATN